MSDVEEADTAPAKAHVYTISAGEVPSDPLIRKFYKAGPDDIHYPVLKQAQPYDRLVIQRGDELDRSYYIVPAYGAP